MTILADYIIDPSGIDWPDVLASWAWLLPPEFTIWIVNRFGDLFLVQEDGSVHWLDVGAGELRRVAESRDHFANLLDDADNARDWLLMPLVEKLVDAGIRLGPGECYGYVKLPILGGDYTVSNTRVVPIAGHLEALGPIHEKLKDLPDGTGVILKPDAD